MCITCTVYVVQVNGTVVDFFRAGLYRFYLLLIYNWIALLTDKVVSMRPVFLNSYNLLYGLVVASFHKCSIYLKAINIHIYAHIYIYMSSTRDLSPTEN